jgi:hypothetical protein
MIDSSLVLPRVRSDIEDQCNKIAKGLANRVRLLTIETRVSSCNAYT